jgi:PhzF family phenazine biosynthesis protein
MADIPCYQVDAFTHRPFAGNPAAVCPLETWLPDATLQAIAAENNLSETAFFVPRGSDFDLRWFTPGTEVDLCGHATLASAFVLMTVREPGRTSVRFHSKSGPLDVTRAGDRYTLDFPARKAAPIPPPPALGAALHLSAPAEAVLKARDLVVVLPRAEDVRALVPDFAAIAALDAFAVMVTASGTGSDGDVDFVSRFFAPAKGVPEDPVTGSAHCTLTPYWVERLGRTRLRARQVSARGGELECALVGDRVRMTGGAVMTRSGVFHLGDP